MYGGETPTRSGASPALKWPRCTAVALSPPGALSLSLSLSLSFSLSRSLSLSLSLSPAGFPGGAELRSLHAL